jgi:cholesterol oxidase
MVDRLSNPIESLIKDKPPEEIFDTVDVAIVGSGYGGSIAAACLAGRGRRVVILERGREYALGDFPVDLGHVPRHVRFQRADSDDRSGIPTPSSTSGWATTWTSSSATVSAALP